MRKSMIETYVCPISRQSLAYEGDAGETELKDGILKPISNSMNVVDSYALKNGVPQFIAAGQLSQLESETKQQYEEYYTEEFYNNIMDWLFKSFYEDEDDIRERLVKPLELKPDSRVLEIGCGTGCDSFRIASKLGKEGVLFVQDLSNSMVSITRDKFEKSASALNLQCEINYFVSSARNLPFPDSYFDAVFHFGGFNNFDDPKGTLEEFSRITKEGGKVVFGDESVPPWLEGTPFGEIVCTNNPLFRYKTPLSALPVSARDVTATWLLGSCFYLIDYKVGSGPPPLNLDLPHKGRRGGTMRTRYYGQLEGVTLEAKQMAQEAASSQGKSLHDWLDEVVRKAASSAS